MLTFQRAYPGRSAVSVLCIAVLFLLATAITGCDENAYEFAADDSNFEAKLESAKMEIDDSNYEAAYQTLTDLAESHPDDARVKEYLSNACAGMVGIDTYNVLEVADEFSDSDVDNGIDLVGRVLGDENYQLTANALQEKQDRLSGCALGYLTSIENMTDDQIVQQGLLSINNAVLTIANIIVEDLEIGEIELTKSNIRNQYSTSAFTDEPTQEELENLSEDVVRITESVTKITEIISDEADANDLSETFSEFTGALDQQRPYGEINAQELINYINNL